MKPIRKIVAALALACPLVASADPCVGPSPFTDVAPADAFCTNTEWLKNRGVTTGCTVTQYCPADNVTRAQMALFMNRLAVALTPQQFFVDASPGGFTFTTIFGDNVCRTANIAPVPYPRRAFVTATYSALSTEAMVHSSRVTYSTDNGATFSWASGYVIRANHPGADWTPTTSSAVVAIPANTQAMFALQFYRESGSGNIGDSRCSLIAIVENENGTSSPFDAQPAARWSSVSTEVE